MSRNTLQRQGKCATNVRYPQALCTTIKAAWSSWRMTCSKQAQIQQRVSQKQQTNEQNGRVCGVLHSQLTGGADCLVWCGSKNVNQETSDSRGCPVESRNRCSHSSAAEVAQQVLPAQPTSSDSDEPRSNLNMFAARATPSIGQALGKRNGASHGRVAGAAMNCDAAATSAAASCHMLW